MLDKPNAIEAMSTSLNIPNLLVAALTRDTERTVLRFDDGRSVTAGEMRDAVSRYQQVFASLGIGPGSRIGLLARNRPEVIDVINASSLADLCLIALHPMGAIADYRYMIEDADITALVFDPAHYEKQAAELQRHVPDLRRLLSFGRSSVGTDILAAAAAFAPTPLVAPVVDGEALHRLSYSGGTTGRPKAIMSSHRAVTVMTQVQLIEWEWPADIRHLVCAPLSHSGAVALMPVLLRGGSMVVLPGFDPLAVLEAIERHRITSTVMVPTMICALLDHPRFDDFDLSSLETVFYGASSFAPGRLREAIARMGPVFFQFYGQAEAPLTVTVLRKGEHAIDDPRRLASCGRPVPWLRVELLDDTGIPVADGEPGEICVRGPLLMSGYLNKPDETAQAFANGWLHTGDVAVRDPGGYLRIVDRKKDMIVTGGFNVFPREVEDAVASQPAVADVAVIGVADARWGEAVKAVVVLRSGASATSEELIALVRERKGAVQAPKSVDFVPAIPLTGLGKPDKKALRAIYAENTQ